MSAPDLTDRERVLVYNALVLLKRTVDSHLGEMIDSLGGYNARNAQEAYESVWLSALQQLEVEGKTQAELEAIHKPPIRYPLEALFGVRLLSSDPADAERFLAAGTTKTRSELACERFHPDEACRLGENHPAVR